MATHNTTLFNSQLPKNASSYAAYSTVAGSEQERALASDAGGQVRVIADTFTTTSAVTTAQYLTLCKLPANAKVVGGTFNVPASAGPTGASKIGIATIAADGTLTVSDDDRYGTVSNINAAAGAYAFQCVTAADFDTAATTELAIVFTPVGASLASGLAIGFTIYYVTN